MGLRAPHMYESLRAFCLAAFAAERGAELPFAFDEHPTRGGPSLYEYRPLVRGFVEEQAPTLRRLPDTRNAIADLRREPVAAIFANARSRFDSNVEDSLFRTILIPLLTAVAEQSGGFDWHDDAFEAAYAELEQSLYGSERAYAALAPLVGLSAGATVELGGGIRVRHAVAGEISQLWPEAEELLPAQFGRETDRMCLLELSRELEHGASAPPEAAAELADAVSALRLATAGAIAAGPVVFERLAGRALSVTPLLPIVATRPCGQSCRLDPVRGALARELRERLALADQDHELEEALDRWELALFQDEPFRSAQLRDALAALLGGGDGAYAAAMRTAALLAEAGRARSELAAALRQGVASELAADAVRRALVATLRHGNRPELVDCLDQALLGLGRERVRALAA